MLFFFLNDPAPTEIYTLSLHDALPIFLCGARPVYVPLAAGEPLDLDRLAGAFSPRTRAIIVCTPNNPTGRVLSGRVVRGLSRLCRRVGAHFGPRRESARHSCTRKHTPRPHPCRLRGDTP